MSASSPAAGAGHGEQRSGGVVDEAAVLPEQRVAVDAHAVALPREVLEDAARAPTSMPGTASTSAAS